MWHEHGLFPQHSVLNINRCHEVDCRRVFPAHAALRRHLAPGGDAPEVDDHLRQAAAPHRDRPGDEGHHAPGLGRISVHQHLVRAWCHLGMDHYIPHPQLVIS